MLVQSGSSSVKEFFVASDEKLIGGSVGVRDIVPVPASGVTLARRGVFSAADGPSYWYFSLPKGTTIRLVSLGSPDTAAVWDVSLSDRSIREGDAHFYLNDVAECLRTLAVLRKLGSLYGYNGWCGLGDDGVIETTNFSAVHRYALQKITWNEGEKIVLGAILACCLAYWPDGMQDPSGWSREGLFARLFKRMGAAGSSSLWAGNSPQKVASALLEMFQ